MKTILIVFGIFLLIAGCATTNPPPVSPPPSTTPPVSNMTCEEYCPTQPHMQCVGQWNISGAYPDCMCGFECEIDQQPENQTEQQNQTTNVSQTDDSPSSHLVNKTVSELLDEGMARIPGEFYANHSGAFQETRYTWVKRTTAGGQDGITIGSNVNVEFDGEAIGSLEASGFYVFTDVEEDSEAYGLAIFRDSTTPLDDYGAADVFGIDYLSLNKELRSCLITSRDYNSDEGDLLITYSFRCARAYDG